MINWANIIDHFYRNMLEDLCYIFKFSNEFDQPFYK